MTATLRIAGWEATGLRCPDHEISFETHEGVYPISLLQMPNGTGKTTVLKLLRTALSGSAADGRWDPDDVRAMRKRGNGNEIGCFRLKLLYNERRYTISLDFDFAEGLVTYSTTHPSGNKQGFKVPKGLERFLRSDFVSFFVFDGELAEQLLDRTHTDAERAIEGLFQLNLLTQIRSRVEEYWRKRTENCSATEERGLNRRRNRVTTLEARLQDIKREQGYLVRRHDELKAEFSSKKTRFQADLDRQREVADRLRQAEATLGEAKQAVVNDAERCLDRMRDPHALSRVIADEMGTLKASLDRVKLPESTAREFFEELAGEELCVCGRLLDENSRAAIRSRASQYLGSDDVALLNSIKGDVGEYVLSTSGEAEDDLLQRLGALRESTRRRGELQTKRDLIESEGVTGHPELEDARDRIQAIEQELMSVEEDLDCFTARTATGRDEEVTSIKELERRLEEAKTKLAEITETVEIKQKRDILLELLAKAVADARARLSADICREANDRIQRLMPENHIRIERIDKCLALQGQEGGSVGETLSVAYAFLATLFNQSAEHDLPFIVDSPANPIDLRVRSRIGELVPRLTGQFIAFTISSERQNFLPALENAATGSIQYVTLFRKGPTDLEESARRFTTCETTDGLCVPERNFFVDFHLESQEG